MLFSLSDRMKAIHTFVAIDFNCKFASLKMDYNKVCQSAIRLLGRNADVLYHYCKAVEAVIPIVCDYAYTQGCKLFYRLTQNPDDLCSKSQEEILLLKNLYDMSSYQDALYARRVSMKALEQTGILSQKQLEELTIYAVEITDYYLSAAVMAGYLGEMETFQRNDTVPSHLLQTLFDL